jgi:hypothetical protein
MLHSLVVKNDTMIHNVIDNIYVYNHLGNFSSASHAELPTKEALAAGPRGPAAKRSAG